MGKQIMYIVKCDEGRGKRSHLAKCEAEMYTCSHEKKVKEHRKCLMSGNSRCGMNMRRFYMISRGNLLFLNHMVHAHMNPLFVLRKK